MKRYLWVYKLKNIFSIERVCSAPFATKEELLSSLYGYDAIEREDIEYVVKTNVYYDTNNREYINE